ncbi:MAG: extracellular solute-binding protein [Lachnospiraceae bacterium]|nr:extracellular solute-binding protein [Lachnospiraceae bacterium]
MKLKKFLALAIASVLVFALVACGNSGANDTATTNGGAETDTNGDAVAEEPTVEPGTEGTLEFWTMFTGADGVNMQAIVDAFNATNPDFTVNHRAMEANDLYMNLPLAIQSGQGIPDIAMNHVERIPVFQENGFLTDLSPMLAANGINPEDYIQKAWDMTSIGGGHYGIPLDVHSFVLYVNMDLYEEFGNGELDDDLLTWDEIFAAAPALEEAGLMAFPITWSRAIFLSMYGQLGGTLSTDGINPDFNNDAAVQVLDVWQELYNNGWSSREGDSAWEMFLGGQAMFTPEGIWMYNNVREAGMNVRMLNFPVFDVNRPGNWTSSHQFVVPTDENREEARYAAIFEFINFVGENALEWAEAGQAPAQISIRESAAFMDMPQAFLTEENAGLLIYDYKFYGYAVEALDGIFDDVRFGRMTPQEGLDRAVQQARDSIEVGGGF